MKKGRDYSISGGFGILIAVLLFLDDQNLVPWALLACLLHEVGHVLAIRLVGGRVAAFRLSVIGAELVPQRDRLFSYHEEMLIAAAGPLMSIALAILSAAWAEHWHSEGAFLFAGLNLAAGVFNLLPAGPLDGGRILKLLLMRWCSIQDGEEVYYRITAVLGLGLLYLGIWHMVKLGGNLTIILTACWLLAGIGRNHG